MKYSVKQVGALALSTAIVLACQLMPGPRGELLLSSPTPTLTATVSATSAAQKPEQTSSPPSSPSPTPQGTPSPAGDTPPSIPDLNGVWDDSGHLIVIVQSGSSVSAAYIEERVCDHRVDAGTTTQYRFDFVARLSLEGDTWTLTSDEFGVCGYGHEDPSRNGLVLTQAQAAISEDWNTISGDWYNSDLADWVVGGIHIVRQFDGGSPVPTPTGFSLPTVSP